jgi:predicted AlkP superfamily phosphohydrolase/phosphomutase
VVCGFGTPNNISAMTHPPELLDRIIDEFGHYIPTVSSALLRTGTPEEIIEVEGNHQALQTQIALKYARHFQVDVLVINLMLPDHANHRIAIMEKIQEAYFQSDSHLKMLIEGFEPDNILLFSDHGSNRLKGNFLLSAWFIDQGYSKFMENSRMQRRAALNWILVQWLQVHHGWSGLGEKIVRNLLREGSQIIPPRFQRKFLRGLEFTVPFAWHHVQFSDRIDYPQSQVFPGSIYSGLIYLNLAGRDPDGMISMQDRESLLSEISAKLLEVEVPGTGQPLFSHIYTSDQIYSGQALENAADLILDAYDSGWNIQMGKYNPVAEGALDRYFVKTENGNRDSGWHSKEGVFVFAGTDFCLGSAPTEGHVMDIPATLLHLYDVPVPEDYDGRVLSELFDPYLKKKPVRYQPGDPRSMTPEHDAYTVEEAEMLADHLRALGYLE